jgi:hypothetical protein
MDETRVDESEEGSPSSLSDILAAAMDEHDSAESQPKSDGAPDSGQAVQTEAPDKEKPSTKETTETTETTQKTEPQEDNPFAPKHWTKAEKEAFDKSPPEVQQAISSLVKNLQKGFTQKAMAAAESRKFVEEIQSSFQPHHRAEMQRYGLNEANTVKELLKLQDQFTRDPIAYVKMVMKSRGITPQHLGFAQQGSDPYAPDAPQTQSSPELEQMRSELAALKGVLQTAASTNVQRNQQAAENLVVNFAHEVDSTGSPVRPHFDLLQPQIAAILTGDPEIASIEHPAERLRAAYDAAVWMHPTTRAEQLAAQESVKKEAWEAERAKSALSVKPRAGGAARKTNSGMMSLDEALGVAMTTHGE